MRGLPGSPLTSEQTGSPDPDGIRERESEEASLLFDKSYRCPVCENEFTARTIRSVKLRRIGTDVDLRVRYKDIDPRRYRILECARCGYAAFDTDFPGLSKQELAAIRQQDQSGGKIIQRGEETVGYEEAFGLYRSALRWALIKRSKNSERANILLYTAWLLRGWRAENAECGLAQTEPATEANELKYLRYAHQYFEQDRLNEDYPVRGMDKTSLDYLMAALCYETGDREQALGYLRVLLADGNTNRQIKTMAWDLKDLMNS